MIPVQDFIAGRFDTAATGRRQAEFDRLARLTALRATGGGDFYRSNVVRGELLYHLVQHLRPATILEFGTGRGFGSMSMAMAAEDAGLDTRIYTVDMVPPTQPQSWALDEGDGPKVVSRSLREVWAQFPAAWTERVRLLTGTSGPVMRDWFADPSRPAVDFAFVDGGHDYWTARHDVLASLLAGRGGRMSLLLDDYGGVQGEAVRRLVDGPLEAALAPAAVHRLEMPQTAVETRDNGEHGMVYVHDADSAAAAAALCGGLGGGAALRGHRAGMAATEAVLRARGTVGGLLRAAGLRRPAGARG
jgi:hypothetical protein